jgi:hypothetical protein
MACHIASASGGLGSRRIDKSLTPTQLRSIENGVWMCGTHGTLVDTDELTYTTPILKGWRRLAEARAARDIAVVQRGDGVPELWSHEALVEVSTRVGPTGELNEQIGTCLRDSGIELLWGKEISRPVRDALIEIAKNAIEHGAATSVELAVEPRLIRLRDNGSPFSSLGLAAGGGTSGGSSALSTLRRLCGARLILAERRDGGVNELALTVPRSQMDVLNATPCSVQITGKDQHRRLSLTAFESCHTVYILLHRFISPSDVGIWVGIVAPVAEAKHVVFVGDGLSDLVREWFQKAFPKAEYFDIAG